MVPGASRRIWVVAGALLALVFGVALVLFWVRTSGRGAQSLGNGVTARLVHVRYAREDRVFTGSIFYQVLRRYLPASLSRRFIAGKSLECRLQADHETLFVWFIIERTNGLTLAPPTWRLTVADREGLESVRLAPAGWVPAGTNQLLIGYEADMFPRHISRFDLLVSATNSVQPLARFTVWNPARLWRHSSTSAPLPQTVTNEGFPFTLVAINTLAATSSVSDLSASRTWTELVFAAGTNGTSISATRAGTLGDWRVKTIECINAGGNRLVDSAPTGKSTRLSGSPDVTGNESALLIRGALWPGDDWTVRAEFERMREPIVLPQHTAIIEGVPVPAPGVTNQVNAQVRMDGATVRLAEVWGIRANTNRQPNAFLQARQRVGLKFATDTNLPISRLRVVKAVDDRGTTIARFGGYPNDVTSEFQLAPLTSATSMTVTVGAVRTWWGEWAVRR